MPDARYYVRQAKILLSLSSGGHDPVLSSRLREIAEDYLAKAVKLKIGIAEYLSSPDLQSHP
ncbi:MAG TPA: hypothetical protein VGL31_19105 [Xanthobacteraceae bacterium]|jgi:siroheme synthase (precorrin-2 oxidase/ferrochelatase)